MVSLLSSEQQRRQTRRVRLDIVLHLFGRLLVVAGLYYVVTLLKLLYNISNNNNNNNNEQNTISSSSLLKNEYRSNNNIKNDNDNNDLCILEYNRVTENRVEGITEEDYERSRAYIGNRYRLQLFVEKLQKQQQPINVIVCGGSISLGHGVTPVTSRYSDQLEIWFNQYYPIQNDKQHRVYNMGSHGADMCAMAKRMNLLEIPNTGVDMFIIEFAVNDYQGQDHKVHLDHKTDVFFNGFHDLAICAETVIHKLLYDFPNTTILFLEFQTAILNRKTAQLLHMGVAQHYQIPVISYADTLWPELYKLIDILQPYDYSIPSSKDMNIDIENIMPSYPHGCTSICHDETIIEAFRKQGCKSVCIFMKRSGYYNKECDTNGDPCYIPFFAHDAVHPSAVGHLIARDLLIDFIMTTALQICNGRTYTTHHLPTHSGWLVAGTNYHNELRARSEYVLVQDTMEIFAKQYPLQPTEHTDGFTLTGDQFADRKGWVATNPKGGEKIIFTIDLPYDKCYAVFLSVLKSYETVGTITVSVEDTDMNGNTKTTLVKQTYDCIWKPHISIPADIQLTPDNFNTPGCTGKCKIIIITNPEIIDGRRGNKIKIVSLSVRKCVDKKN